LVFGKGLRSFDVFGKGSFYVFCYLWNLPKSGAAVGVCSNGGAVCLIREFFGVFFFVVVVVGREATYQVTLECAFGIQF